MAKIHLLSNEVKIVPAAITQLSLRQSSPFKSHSEALCGGLGTVWGVVVVAFVVVVVVDVVVVVFVVAAVVVMVVVVAVVDKEDTFVDWAFVCEILTLVPSRWSVGDPSRYASLWWSPIIQRQGGHTTWASPCSPIFARLSKSALAFVTGFSVTFTFCSVLNSFLKASFPCVGVSGCCCSRESSFKGSELLSRSTSFSCEWQLYNYSLSSHQFPHYCTIEPPLKPTLAAGSANANRNSKSQVHRKTATFNI